MIVTGHVDMGLGEAICDHLCVISQIRCRRPVIHKDAEQLDVSAHHESRGHLAI